MSKTRPKSPAVVQPPPKLFVLAINWRGSRDFRPANIRIRRGVYRYLIWREDNKKHEFYLGKVKPRTGQDLLARGARPAAAAAAPARSRGGTKSASRKARK